MSSTGIDRWPAAFTGLTSSTTKCPCVSASAKASRMLAALAKNGARSLATVRKSENVEMPTILVTRGSSTAAWIATAAPSDTPIRETAGTLRKSMALARSRFS